MVNPTQQFAFANATLGSSFNYEKLNYTFPNGETLTKGLIKMTSELIKNIHMRFTDNGDMALIDSRCITWT